MDIIETCIKVFTTLGVIDSLIFSLIISIIGSGSYYIRNIYPKQLEAKEKREADRIAIEERKDNERSQIALQQNALLANNNTVVENLSESVRILNLTFEKVSDRLSSHDERSIHMATMLQAHTSSLAALSEKMPNNDSLVRIHERLDDLRKDGADKSDVNQICIAIAKLDQNISKVNENIAEIKGRVN